MIAKAQAMWAEHVCEAPFEQWTLGNETYAVALDDPDEGLGRAYGDAGADRRPTWSGTRPLPPSGSWTGTSSAASSTAWSS